MSLDLHEVLKYFFNLDIPQLTKRVNHMTCTVWWSNEHDEPIIQLGGDLSVMRLYVLDSEMDIKITYIPQKNTLISNTLNPNTVLKITDLDTLQSCESFFQRSLIDDLGGILYEDIVQLKKMYSELLEIKNTVIVGS